jgi:hypothetical protein
MACCAFAAFVIGQCLALVDGWRRRIARLLHLPVLQPAVVARPARASRRWKTGLLAAVVLELGMAAGFAIVAWAASPAGTALAALCTPGAR